jgi:esterase/lipase superfamily enzyme
MLNAVPPFAESSPSRSNRAARIVASIALLLTTSACAGHPDGLLAPVVAPAPDAASVEMLVATSRGEGTSPGQLFTGERGTRLGFADVAVSIPPDLLRTVGEVQWPAGAVADPATEFAPVKVERIDRQAAMAMLHRPGGRAKARHVLVFVHGYNNRFEDAVFRFAQIVHDSRAPVTPVLFTWPSRAKVLAYGYDRESTSFSRDAFEEVLRMLANDRSVSQVSILAHSMGNWLTLETLRQMAIRDGRVPGKIRDVILAAPDVDVDLFRNDLASLGPHRPSMTLVVSQDDKALALSRRVWGDSVRLGAIDPAAEPLRSELARDGVKVVDVTGVDAGDGLAHSKFADSPEVVRLLSERLVAGQTVTDSRVGISDRIVQLTASAASSAGSAAGLVLAAPIAVVDPDARSRYGEQMSGFGASVSETAKSGSGMIGAALPSGIR